MPVGNHRRRLALLLTAIVTAGILAACGNGDDSAAQGVSAEVPASAAFNTADVTFAQSMIPHHNQAVEMARMAETNAASPAVKKLAADIAAAQAPEITTMQRWLADWGRSLPVGMDTMAGMETMIGQPGMEGMEGMEGMDATMAMMMSTVEMADMEKAKGKAFDRLFLQMMTEHHRGAIELAKTEQAQGKYPEAKALAGKIVKNQTAEIARMTKLRKN